MDIIEENQFGRRRKIKKTNPHLMEDQEHVQKFFKSLKFLASATDKKYFPPETMPEVAILGRSNVGKSTLLNSLGNHYLARVSDKPGQTKNINFYHFDNQLGLVDLPGYGFAFAKEEKRKAWNELISEYLLKRTTLKRLLLLIDARHSFKESDRELMDKLDRNNVKLRYQIVLTKTDLVVPNDLARRYYLVDQEIQTRKRALKRILLVSGKDKRGIAALRAEIAGLVLKEEQMPKKIEQQEVAKEHKENNSFGSRNAKLKGPKKIITKSTWLRARNAKLKENKKFSKKLTRRPKFSTTSFSSDKDKDNFREVPEKIKTPKPFKTKSNKN
uniref:EngB-type G domain-containing protein n=1 Tax=Arcella intermedia TaxID=1963864 RepID=A0A6B2L986_9EUKA